MPVSTELDNQAYQDFMERAKGLKAENRSRSVRQAIFDSFPDIQRAIENGMTRQEVYDQLLTDDLKKKIKPSTFMGYYHLAKKAHMAEAARLAKEARKAERETAPAAENAAPVKTPVPSTSGNAVQKAMQAASCENGGSSISSEINFLKKREI